MRQFSDEDIIRELEGRLHAKDEANQSLTAMARKLKAVNDKLVESEKLKTHFLSNIRNEINNPLTSVLTSCEIILSEGGPKDYETLKSVIGMIHKEAFNLDFQLGNIFFAAELEAGESAVSLSSVDMASTLRSVAASFQQKAVDAGVKIIIDLSALNDDRSFRTDAAKLRCIVSNLLSNAIEYGAGSPVEIKAGKTWANLNISVKDSGPGIDAADQGAIFERFKQLESGSTKSHGGHGLGLSVVRALLDALGGSIALTGGKGEGAEFKISIPEGIERETVGAFSSEGNDFFFEGEKF
jgi:signal transduction histidine kinase